MYFFFFVWIDWIIFLVFSLHITFLYFPKLKNCIHHISEIYTWNETKLIKSWDYLKYFIIEYLPLYFDFIFYFNYFKTFTESEYWAIKHKKSIQLFTLNIFLFRDCEVLAARCGKCPWTFGASYWRISNGQWKMPNAS